MGVPNPCSWVDCPWSPGGEHEHTAQGVLFSAPLDVRRVLPLHAGISPEVPEGEPDHLTAAVLWPSDPGSQ